jgi:hypothetical protein
MDLMLWLIPLLLGSPLPQSVLAARTPNDVRGVTIAPDASVVAAAMADRAVRQWAVTTGHELPAIKLTAPVSEVAFAADGRRLATLSSNLELWDAPSGKRLRALPDVTASQLAFAADGRLAVAGHRLGLLEAGTLRRGPEFAEQAGWLNTCVAYSGDGKLVAAGDTAGNVWVWETAKGTQRLRRKGHTNRVNGVGFIDNGRTLVSGGSDGRMKFWDLATGREIGTLFPHDTAGLGRGIGALACSPDGKTIVTGGADDGRVKLWEAASGQLRATLPLPGTGVTSVAIALGGSTIVAGGRRPDGGVVASWQLYATGTGVALPVRPSLWHDLAGDAPAAYHAILILAAHPRDAVALLKQRLRPVTLNPAVRKECDGLIAALDSDTFDVRDQANAKLEAMSPWIEAYLRQALPRAKTLEIQHRLQALLARVGPSTLPLMRAIEVLEHAPGPEARKLLRQLADGEPQARITTEARHALDRQNLSTKSSSTKDTKEHEEDQDTKLRKGT